MALSESRFGSPREANLKAGAPEFALAKVRWPKVWATGGGFELPFKKLMGRISSTLATASSSAEPTLVK